MPPELDTEEKGRNHRRGGEAELRASLGRSRGLLRNGGGRHGSVVADPREVGQAVVDREGCTLVNVAIACTVAPCKLHTHATTYDARRFHEVAEVGNPGQNRAKGWLAYRAVN